MRRDVVSFWNSVVSRFGLFFIALIVSAIFVSGYLVYTESSKVITAHGKERIKYTSNLARQSFYSLLDVVANDIAVLAENPVLKDFVSFPSEVSKNNLQNLFRVTLKNKSSYFQARFISTKDYGKEIVRLDKVNSEVIQIPEDKLQYKTSKLYFTETMNYQKGEYYFSPINLNEEHGIVSTPHTPTFRAASPIFDRMGQSVGVLVINVSLIGFYNNLNQIMQSGIELVIVDEFGQYLFAPKMSKCFGQQLEHTESFDRGFNQSVPETINSSKEFNTIKNDEGSNILYHVEELSYAQGQSSMFLFSMIEESLVLKNAHMVRNKSFKTIIIVCLIALSLAVLFTRFFSKRITEITAVISSYDVEEAPIERLVLTEKRKDEIGMLARTFIKMKSKIDQQVDELKVSLKKEKKAIKEKDEFLQNMSHELRTPLNGIIGLTQLLRKNDLRDDQKPIVESLDRSANNLAGLMYDILDHQKITEGKVQLKPAPCNVYKQLQDIYASYQFETISKHLNFELEVDDKLKDSFYQVDALRFTQIVTNLVVNAIKYTNKGEIKLIGSFVENDQRLVIKVIDTGIGIKPENLEKIKNRFYREQEEVSGTHRGFGLGLSIVKQLIDLFDGELDVQSHKGAGSMFVVSFPVIEVDKSEVPKINQVDGVVMPQLAKEYIVLHIEDDLSSQQLVGHILNRSNIRLIQVNAIEQVNSILKECTPDLIISDLMLEEHNIEQSLVSLMSRESMCPILLISAFDENQMKSICSDFMQKPIDVNELLDRVYVFLGKDEFDIPELKVIYSQYDFDKKRIANFLALLVEEFGNYLGRIERVYESKDPKEWKAITHKIITHIKSMKLKGLSKVIPERVEDLDSKKVEIIKNAILYCLCFFRVEQVTMTKV